MLRYTDIEFKMSMALQYNTQFQNVDSFKVEKVMSGI
jgi:hypothetical protein